MSRKGKGQTGPAPRTGGSAAPMRVQEPPVRVQDVRLRTHGSGDAIEDLRAQVEAKRQESELSGEEADALAEELAALEAEEAEDALRERIDASRLWPEGDTLPTTYQPRPKLPCPHCRRVLMDNGGQAVVAASVGQETAFLRCKSCGHRWQLPVVRR